MRKRARTVLCGGDQRWLPLPRQLDNEPIQLMGWSVTQNRKTEPAVNRVFSLQ